mmetsp:Transcript_24701/g.44725  ORF Transcript_24701/g.44725 Transcript_24701/m.44725 type:complete len:289 (-) Transcript_24701:1171-2037(-)
MERTYRPMPYSHKSSAPHCKVALIFIMSGKDTQAVVELLPSLKEELGQSAHGVSDENLVKFLNWKPSVDRAAGRYKSHVKWRKENPFAFETRPLRAGDDAELKRVLESDTLVAPDDLVDKEGSPVMLGRLRHNDMTDGRTVEDVCRMIIYTIDRVLERETAQIHGITVFHDLTGITTKNVDKKIPKLLLGAIVNHFPIRIKAVYILNAPIFFRIIFSVIQYLMPKKLRSRFNFISDITEVYKVIDQDQLLEEHGGKRKHNSAEWVAAQIKRETDGTMVSLKECLVSSA